MRGSRNLLAVGTALASLPSLGLLATPRTVAAQDLPPGQMALRPAEVDAAAAARTGQVKRCYAQALKRLPKLYGVVGVGMKVSPAGQVQERWITISTLGDPALERCLLDAFEGLTFPAPGEPGAVVRYGMLLTTKDTPEGAARTQEEAYRRSLRSGGRSYE